MHFPLHHVSVHYCGRSILCRELGVFDPIVNTYGLLHKKGKEYKNAVIVRLIYLSTYMYNLTI